MSSRSDRWVMLPARPGPAHPTAADAVLRTRPTAWSRRGRLAAGFWITSLLTALGCADDEPIFVEPPPSNPDCLPAPSGLLHFWPADGTGRDVIGGADASLLDGAGYTEGFVASRDALAFRFDGVDASARVPDRPSLNPTVGFTLTAWARLDSDAAFTGPVAGKGRHTDEAFVIDHFAGGWRGFIRSAGRGAQVIQAGPFALGLWTHLALTWDGAELAFYVNGARIGTRTVDSINTSDSFFAIGYRNEAGFTDEELDFEFEGAIDEVGYFDRQLSAAEIALIFNSGSRGICQS